MTNPSIRGALVDLLGKPIEESNALIVPTAIYPFRGGSQLAWGAITGTFGGPLTNLGWRSLGVLEPTALPSIDDEVWQSTVKEADAILFWGGDPLYLAHWLRESDLSKLLRTLTDTVYVGTSAGSIAACTTFGETYIDPPNGTGKPLTTERVTFETPHGPVERILAIANGAGLVDFAVTPHLDHEHHEDASMANAEIWASKIPVPTYAIDDDWAIAVVDGEARVVSEGQWKLFA